MVPKPSKPAPKKVKSSVVNGVTLPVFPGSVGVARMVSVGVGTALVGVTVRVTTGVGLGSCICFA